MSQHKIKRRIGKYEVGRTIGEGTYAKVKFARNIETGEHVAIKILDKDMVLKHKMAEQVHFISLLRKSSPVIVGDGEQDQDIYCFGICHWGELFDKIPENLLLDAAGNLKVSDFGLSALSQQVRDDGLLHTTCGTPNYVAPEVLNDRGYNGANGRPLISNAEFTCPPWLSFGAMKLITQILDPNPEKRITIPEILEDEWFKKDYKSPVFDEEEDINLDDVEAVFKDCEEYHVTEKKEQPAAMNAFELISMSKGLNLGNLFDVQQGFKRETRFTSKSSATEIINKIEEAAKPLGFDMRLENLKAGRKGNLNVATEVFQVAPSLHMVEVRKAKGDTLEFHKFYKNLSTSLEDVVWKTEEDMQEMKK
ncbi:hypothetical protein DH2020_000936 [Rehmannia glutinosa]|uniref:non-specific serine/threonine protein kinase n=1 Tax=Rehmannia glutinosa TaxID=99300 RepID=A0ABR0XY08_REHGL